MKLAIATEPHAAWELPSAVAARESPSTGKVGMWGLIAAESAIFVIFIVAYAFYIGKSTSGPTPAVLHTPIFLTVCLLSSSATMELALRALGRGASQPFAAWRFTTLGLAATFLTGTGLEWRHLIVDEGLTIHTNLFGTTYYSLVGLHAFHVLVGLTLMAIVGTFVAFRRVTREHEPKLEVISLYWHFVDV